MSKHTPCHVKEDLCREISKNSVYFLTSANLHFSSQVSCVFLCFCVSGNTATQQHGNYTTITLEVDSDYVKFLHVSCVSLCFSLLQTSMFSEEKVVVAVFPSSKCFCVFSRVSHVAQHAETRMQDC